MDAHRLRALAITMFSALLLQACASQDDRATMLITALQQFGGAAETKAGPKDRIQFEGWSILSPDGEHWIEQRLVPDPNANWQIPIAFVKLVPQRNSEIGFHTVIAAAETHKLIESERHQAGTMTGRRNFLNEGLEFLMETAKATAEAKQDNIISSKGRLDTSMGYDCLRYDVFVESRRYEALEGRTFYTEYHTYACMDPGTRMVVKLSYGQRVPPDTSPVDLGSEGEAFFRSLRFTSPTS